MPKETDQKPKQLIQIPAQFILLGAETIIFVPTNDARTEYARYKLEYNLVVYMESSATVTKI